MLNFKYNWTVKLSDKVSVIQSQIERLMPMNRAASFLIEKKGNNRVNKSHISLQSLFILEVIPTEKLLLWQAGLWLAYFVDQKPSLPSSLLPWGECVSCSSVPPGLRVHVRAVCECFRSQSANHTRSGKIRSGSWFLEKWTAAQPQTNATTRDS